MRKTNIKRRVIKAISVTVAMALFAVGAVVSCTVDHDDANKDPGGPVKGNRAKDTGNDPAMVLGALAALGIELAPGGTSGAELLYPAPGEVYEMESPTVNSEWLHIDRYTSTKAASDHAAWIQGDQRLHLLIDWIAPPHFFRRDSLVALYLGVQAMVIEQLPALCGPQFAGD